MPQRSNRHPGEGEDPVSLAKSLDSRVRWNDVGHSASVNFCSPWLKSNRWIRAGSPKKDCGILKHIDESQYFPRGTAVAFEHPCFAFADFSRRNRL
jgi:hypothetical protein